MNERYGSRVERDDRDRRAMRDSRDQRYGGRSPSDEQDDERYESEFGGRQGRDQDPYGEHRSGGFEQGRPGMRSNDDFYGRGGQSDWSSRGYPRSQRSFERAGYDVDREYWEGQRFQSGQSGQFPQQPGASRYGGGSHYGQQLYGGAPEYSGERGGAGAYPHEQYGQARPGGQWRGQHGQQHHGSQHGNYWEHGGGYDPGRHGEPLYGGGQGGGNFWEHAGGGQYGQPRHGEWYGQGQQGGYGGGMGAAGGLSRNRPPKGYTRSDERLKEDICERLMSAPHIDAGNVSVEVKDGKVTLEGTVDERSMKHRIEDIAEACSGVKDVDNKIRVARSSGEYRAEHGFGGSGARTAGAASGTGSTSRK